MDDRCRLRRGALKLRGAVGLLQHACEQIGVARPMGHSNIETSMRCVQPKVEDLFIAVESVFAQNGHYSETGRGAVERMTA